MFAGRPARRIDAANVVTDDIGRQIFPCARRRSPNTTRSSFGRSPEAAFNEGHFPRAHQTGRARERFEKGEFSKALKTDTTTHLTL